MDDFQAMYDHDVEEEILNQREMEEGASSERHHQMEVETKSLPTQQVQIVCEFDVN